ncbi:MAG: NADH-quinone oxidoreductase subunit NuoH [Candidatus Omnitrophica bacterium]|nr:NADH-quinone oxidoreductase subunit NuoH [Candidatus Omnitrophota bacterium]
MGSLDQLFVHANAALLKAADALLPEGTLPWVSILVRIGVIAAIAPAIMMYLTLFERKVIARMQNRFGPTRVGAYGLLQPLSDGLKMLIKEDITPRSADHLVHLLAPIVAVVPAILLFAVMPFGRNMIAADLNVGLLYVLAVGSISSYAIFMGGWASRNKFSVLGAMRSVAQIVSYETPSVLSVVVLIMVTGTMSLVGIVEAQRDVWFVFTPWGFAAAVIFFLGGIAEVNRTPFDMPEAESELVGGFHTEYSGMKFALWYMAEFLEAFAVCAFTTTLFLGGWHGPAVPFWVLALLLAAIFATGRHLWLAVRLAGAAAMLGAAALWGAQPIPSWIWFLAKTYALFFVLVWLRGTFPRLRVDQLMGLAWKFLLPLAMANILAAGFWVMVPGAAGAVLSLATVAGSWWLLVLANRPAPMERRTYVFAD